MKNLKKKLSKMAVSLLLATTNALTANPVITVSAVESTESPESVKEVVETAQPEGFDENLVAAEGQKGGEETNSYENNQSP
ncbi:MAG: hypothetical protein IKH50_12075, partial [Oscillospiraceae bacterium]|nr:hypothetical protein [Oscillospiraceae bacterium]